MHVIAIAAMFVGAALALTAVMSSARRSEALVPVRVRRQRR